MNTDQLLNGIRLSLSKCQLQMVSSMKDMLRILISDGSINDRRSSCDANIIQIKHNTKIIMDILQSETPRWVHNISSGLDNFKNNNYHPEFLYSLLTKEFLTAETYSFNKLEDTVNDKEKEIIEVDCSNIDERIKQIVKELEWILENCGSKISAQVEKELIDLIKRIKVSQFKSLFGRRVGLLMVALFLGQFVPLPEPIEKSELMERIHSVKEFVSKTIDVTKEAENDALIENMARISFNGNKISLQNVNIIISGNEHVK